MIASEGFPATADHPLWKTKAYSEAMKIGYRVKAK